MKFSVSFNTPDTVSEAIREAVRQEFPLEEDQMSDEQRERRTALELSLNWLASKFTEFGEFVVIDFDTADQTASVRQLRK